LPFSIPYFLKRQRGKLNNTEFKEKFGSAYNGLKTSRDSFMLYNGFYCLRRLIFSVSVVFFKDYTILQNLFCLVSPTLMLIYIIKVKPYQLKILNYVEISNEVTILIAGYFFIGFSNYVLDAKVKSDLG